MAKDLPRHSRNTDLARSARVPRRPSIKGLLRISCAKAALATTARVCGVAILAAGFGEEIAMRGVAGGGTVWPGALSPPPGGR